MSLFSQKVAMTCLSCIEIRYFLYTRKPLCIRFPDFVGMTHLLYQQILNIERKLFKNLLVSGLCRQ
jgi:hypothetical protein